MIRKEIRTALENLGIKEEDFISAVSRLPEPKDSKEMIYLIAFFRSPKSLDITDPSPAMTKPLILQAHRQHFNWTGHNVCYEDWAIKVAELTVGRLEVAYDI